MIAPEPYTGPEQRQSMIDLLMRNRPPEQIDSYPSPTDIHELLAQESVQSRTRLWVNRDGGVAAFALVDDFNNLRFEIDPRYSNSDLEAEVVAWGVDCLKREYAQAGDLPTLDASCREDDTRQTAFLVRHGFIQSAERTLHMVRSLLSPIPERSLPAGFIIRPAAGADEAQALVELHRAAFGTTHMTLELRLAMMDVPDYDPDLDLVAVAPDGQLVGYCFCYISHAENAQTGRLDGYTDPVAVHPDYQRRGLAHAMLSVGLRLLKERGMHTARLSTSAANLAMQRAAESAGFNIESVTIWFSKEITENTGDESLR